MPWDFVSLTPTQQGWIIAIMEMEIEAELRRHTAAEEA